MEQKIHNILRWFFYGVVVRPILLLILGFNARHMERLKPRGAHLIAANHNSHLDAMVLMSLFKLCDLPKVKVVAAKDYFCRTPLMAWFSINVIGVIPIDRQGGADNPIQPVIDALEEGYTVIIFPEGSRGDPEQQAPLKYGVTKVLEAHPDVQITPVYMHGLGKALPRGEALLVPFVCEINIGEPISWHGDRAKLIESLGASFAHLKNEMDVKPWQ